MKIVVDLSLPRSYVTTDIEHSGTELDPYSWSDVKKHLQLAATDGYDDGSTLDTARPLDSDGFAVEFLCFGTGDVLSDSDKINISNVRFNDASHTLKFSGYNPKVNGIPVLTSKLSDPIIGSWFGLSNSANLDFDFNGFIIDTNQATTYDLLDFAAALNPTIRVQNNILLSRSAGMSLVSCASMQYLKLATCKNTIMVNSPSTVSHNLVKLSGSHFQGEAVILANYVARHVDTANTVTFASHTTGVTVTTSGNRFAYSSGFNDYVGQGIRNALEADLTLNYTNQGVFNDSLFNGVGNYSSKQHTGFWPVHRGSLLNVCSKPSTLFGTLNADILGRQILGNVIDAGAFQKNFSATLEEIHVDLSLAVSDPTRTGQEDAPLTLPDFLLDYSRRAPVACDHVYILRNENSVAVSSWDLGPLCPDTSVSDRSYSGNNGSTVVFTSYKKHSLNQALLRINAMLPNAKMNIVFDNVRILWEQGIDLIKTGQVANPGYTFAVERCVVKSTALCTQSFVDQANNTCNVRVAGSTVIAEQLQANLDAAGLFVNGTNTNMDIVLCTLVTPSTRIGSANGNAKLLGCYVNGVLSGDFFGATVQHVRFNQANLDTVFVDHDNADFRKADFRLTATQGNARDIVEAPNVLGAYYDFVKYDARGLLRDASGNGGSYSLDAGAYEYDYYIPQVKRYFVDLNKTSQGHSGKQQDRFSAADLKNYLSSLSNTLLDTVNEFVIAGYAKLSALISNVESLDTGSIKLVNDNPNNIAVLASGSPVLEFVDCVNTNIVLDGVIVKSDVTDASILLSTVNGTFNSKLSVNRSLLWKKHRAYFKFDDTSNLVGSMFSCGIYTVSASVDFVIGATITDSLRAIASGFNNEAGFSNDYTCYVDGYLLVFVAIASSLCDLDTDAVNVSIHDAVVDSCSVKVQAGWTNEMFGTTICESFDQGVQRTTIGVLFETGSFGKLQAIAFQGDSAKSGLSVDSSSGDVAVVDSKYSGFQAPTGCSLSNTTTSAALYSSNYGDEPIAASNFTLLDGFNIATFTDIDSNNDYGFDTHLDISGNNRSQVYTLGLDTCDVGAFELNKLTVNPSFAGETDAPVAMLTPQGSSLNIRQDIDGLCFKLVGFTLNNDGYLYWQPNKVSNIMLTGMQAQAVVTLTGNTFNAGDRVVVTYGTHTTTALFNALNGFVAGSTTLETATNILRSLNTDANFRNYFYGRVSGSNIIEIFAKQFGVVGNAYACTRVGASLTASGFSGGSDAGFELSKVWPVASTYSPFERIETPDQSSQSYVVRLTNDQANFMFGELCLIAMIVSSNIPEEVGTYVTYAIARFGLHAKHNREVLVKRFIFQF